MKFLLAILTILIFGGAHMANAKPSNGSLVNGIGGVFIYAKNPQALAKWYTDKLEIKFEYNQQDDSYYVLFPQSDKKFTVLSFFQLKEKKSRTKQFMLNLRLNNLDETLKKLQAN